MNSRMISGIKWLSAKVYTNMECNEAGYFLVWIGIALVIISVVTRFIVTKRRR